MLLPFCSVFGCAEKPNFSYEVLDPRINIDNLPFGRNKDFDEDKMYPIEYVKTGEKIQTSVYLFAAAGSCVGNTIDPFIQERSDSLILSFKLRKRKCKQCLSDNEFAEIKLFDGN